MRIAEWNPGFAAPVSAIRTGGLSRGGYDSPASGLLRVLGELRRAFRPFRPDRNRDVGALAFETRIWWRSTLCRTVSWLVLVVEE